IEVGDEVLIGAQSGISGNAKSGSRLMGSPAIDMGKYARNVVVEKNLRDLYDRVTSLEKELASLKNAN
ncbi:MAG: UDP-3-O-(3-hydroxymyristoyl)glucosamine N-acyltransferase, partial [Muribaculaceae bacterium]|nr:UDP-3-O-(3-hydroxymyristoyl)glucosamine N-acyltransferase [Muribaculaceae bacterium]